jgi:plasmid stabilization system protein ParE
VNVKFLTLAQQEVDEAVLWFEERQPGTGTDFLIAFDEVVHFVKDYPFASTEIEPGLRRCLFVDFPYSLIYGIEGETIVVVAVAHTRRHPRYWDERIH